MCNTQELVPIPQWLFDLGGVKMKERPDDESDWGFDPTHPEYGFNDDGERCLRLDSCIVPAIKALWAAGIVTVSCCCGHDESPHGVISIQRPTASLEGRGAESDPCLEKK